MKKTWKQKYEARTEVVVEVVQKPMLGMRPGQRLLISTPAEIEAWVRQIPYGAVSSVAELRQELARTHDADGTCPMTTSIFLRIVAERGLEEGDPAPFWRVIDPKSPLAQKLSCGPDWIVGKRAEEAQKS